jgi:hypothetical protein
MTAPVNAQLSLSTGTGQVAPVMPIPVTVMAEGSVPMAPTSVQLVRVLTGVEYAPVDPIPIVWTVDTNLPQNPSMPIPVVVV